MRRSHPKLAGLEKKHQEKRERERLLRIDTRLRLVRRNQAERLSPQIWRREERMQRFGV